MDKKIRGLDSIRFFAAMWVVFSHCGSFPLFAGFDETNLFAHVLSGIYNNAFSGPAAVIVFFVISGFCIHYPHRSAEKIDVISYLLRRYLRIGVPLAAAILVAKRLAIRLTLFEDSILWSLAAELIYYTLYPVLRRVRARMPFGWKGLIALAYLFSLAVVLSGPDAKNYPSYGLMLNWILGLPCWLLGCLLAESPAIARQNPAPAAAWAWRFGIVALATLCSILRFHSPVGYPWTLNLFAVAVYFWIGREIQFFNGMPANRLFEWAGAWSYSIYLMHVPFNKIYGSSEPMPFGPILNWTFLMLSVLAGCYVFYLIVERPGHLVGRRLSGWMSARAENAAHLKTGAAAIR